MRFCFSFFFYLEFAELLESLNLCVFFFFFAKYGKLSAIISSKTFFPFHILFYFWDFSDTNSRLFGLLKALLSSVHFFLSLLFRSGDLYWFIFRFTDYFLSSPPFFWPIHWVYSGYCDLWFWNFHFVLHISVSLLRLSIFPFFWRVSILFSWIILIIAAL